MKSISSKGLAFLALVICLHFGLGCAQDTRAPQMADTRQDTAAEGSTVYVIFNNGADGGGPVAPGIVPIGDALDAAIATAHASDGQDSKAASGGYVLSGRDTYVTINTGSTTPSQASTSTGTQTVSPNQQPEASVAADIAAGGTVAADQGATSGQGSGTVSSEKQSQLDQQIADVKATADKLESLLNRILGQQPTAEPETQPSEE
jgi:hypothetical protein